MKGGLRDRSGFTLVELLVVIAIIGILAAIITPNAFKAIEKGKVAAAEADYKAIKAAVLNYYTDTGQWPGMGSDNGSRETEMFVTGVNVPNGWNGPYLERWPSKNPWGGYYKFVNWTANDSPWGSPARWVELSSVPGANGNSSTGAAKRLQDDLGEDVVKFDGSLVKILVSKD
ncbi:prepilin-type N-terminal cleavage/methylation domain-containing protein [Desulfofundulus thermosubterraneus]|uniref:General secretion pathway protein G n=1 Tax=Desulfofundulus thermosubterraneus DSM 16057 TaxID=1121432 RepID=A0A1M6GGF7_9FIRM|nr:prepilin-type N-terminal cleavage/methylation domain-containing protein [Desulfofundulus thermosubterraneus]SHJ08997.1 general secretion pathway protein G [Desulfofundulus thermosubterraneus DSM 16057]